MLENIVRHMEKGTPALQAAFAGSREVGFTILSMTLSLAAVFIPVLFMGGIVGRLFHEFAVTIGAAILVSGLVSLTLTPMLCSRFLKPSREAHHGRFYEASERVYQRVLHWYEGTLGWVMERRPAAAAPRACISSRSRARTGSRCTTTRIGSPASSASSLTCSTSRATCRSRTRKPR